MLLDTLKEKNLIMPTTFNTLKHEFSENFQSILLSEFQSEQQRIIMKLPHSSSLRYWTSTVDINPGFLSKVLEELKKLSC